MASMIYALLKTDQETLNQVPPGETPPAPMLYDREIHRKHQEGFYRSLKPKTLLRQDSSPSKQVVIPSQEKPLRFLLPTTRKRGKPQASRKA
jgi:hypothetical protein